jgi:Outer membrane protein beta-barrel domain
VKYLRGWRPCGDFAHKGLVRGLCAVAFLISFSEPLAHAQNGLDVYFGVGTMQADSSGQSIDTFNTGTLYSTPKLTGTFGKVGADFMLTRQFGIGGDADFRFSQGDYAGLNYRPTFYDFYGIWAPPIKSKRIVPEFRAGLGAANLRFFYPSSYCDQFTGCSSSSTYLESSTHFQTRLGFGVSFYATDHIFFRPEIDAHWVNNFFQFGSNWVPEYSVAVGYRFGEH